MVQLGRQRYSEAVTIRPIENSNNLIENQSFNLPASSSIPQITTLRLDPRVNLYMYFLIFYLRSYFNVDERLDILQEVKSTF
jgi:hypothetical protein